MALPEAWRRNELVEEGSCTRGVAAWRSMGTFRHGGRTPAGQQTESRGQGASWAADGIARKGRDNGIQPGPGTDRGRVSPPIDLVGQT